MASRRLAVLLMTTLVVLVVVSVSRADRSLSFPGFRVGAVTCVYYSTHTVYGPRPEALLCTVAQASYVKAFTKKCRTDPPWSGFYLTATEFGTVSCGPLGYTPILTGPPLTAMHPWHKGHFTCTRRNTTVSCKNADGHGMSMSQQRYKFY